MSGIRERKDHKKNNDRNDWNPGHGGSVLLALNQIPDEVKTVGFAKVLPEDNLQDLREQLSICREAPIYENSGRLLADIRPQVVIVGTRLDQIAPADLAGKPS